MFYMHYEEYLLYYILGNFYLIYFFILKIYI